MSVLARDKNINQLKSEDKSVSITTIFPSTCVKEPAMWPFMSMHRHVLPELYMILGVGNKIMNSFWDFIHDVVENLPHELTEKQNMTIIVHISLKRLEEEVDE